MCKRDLVVILGLVGVMSIVAATPSGCASPDRSAGGGSGTARMGDALETASSLPTLTRVAGLGAIEGVFAVSGVAASSSQEELPAAPGAFEGDGSRALPVWFDEGAWLIGLKHEGLGKFAVVLYDEEGKHLRDLADATGSFSYVASISIECAGMHSLDITADGSWRITIRGCTCPGKPLMTP